MTLQRLQEYYNANNINLEDLGLHEDVLGDTDLQLNSIQFNEGSVNSSPLQPCHPRSRSSRKGKEVVGKGKDFACGQ